MKQLHWFGHASFRIETEKGFNIYFDPWRLPPSAPKAGLVLITHAHHDHCSADDIAAVAGPETVIAGPAQIRDALRQDTIVLAAGTDTLLCNIAIEPLPSYNIGKKFHPLQGGNLGYVITVDGVRYYHAGDTDLIPEMTGLKTDYALLPIGGTYTMNPAEAARAAAIIKPAVAAVPMHYGKHVGSYSQAEEFKKLASVPVLIMREEK